MIDWLYLIAMIACVFAIAFVVAHVTWPLICLFVVAWVALGFIVNASKRYKRGRNETD
jgi:uncharacterized membrane protein